MMADDQADDLTTRWVWASHAINVASFVLLVVTMIAQRVWLFVPLFLVTFLGTYLVSEKRSWWGPGPARLLADPELKRAMRNRDNGLRALGLVVVIVCAYLLVATGSV